MVKKKEVVKKKMVKKKVVKKKVVWSDEIGQGVIDFMVDELGFDDVVEGFERRIDSDDFIFKEDKENLHRKLSRVYGVWTIEINDPDWGAVGCLFVEQRFNKGDPIQKIEFQGEGNLLKKWIKKNWKEVVNGQDVIDWMVDDLSFDEVVEGFGRIIESQTLNAKDEDVNFGCFDFEEDKENLTKEWTIEIDDPTWGEVGSIYAKLEYDTGDPSQKIDEDDVFYGCVKWSEIKFLGDGKLLKKWLKKNWKEVYKSYDWK